MPAIAKTPDFKNQTFKQVILHCFKKALPLSQAITLLGKNFPTKVGNPKKVERLTRALTTYQSQYNNGRYSYQTMAIIKVPAPTTKVFLKGLEPTRTAKPAKPVSEKAKTRVIVKAKKPAKPTKVAKVKLSTKPKKAAKTTEPEVIDLT